MKIENIIKLGKLTALGSFLIGTAIFLSYYFTENSRLFLIGYYFISAAIFVNIIVLIWLVTFSTKEAKIKKELNRTKKLILLNIPIAIVYFFLVMTLLSYMRVTFINESEFELTNIIIYGCEDSSIKKLLPNERKTKWILIDGDCMIEVKYLENGIEQKEIVASYLSGPMGQKITHEFGGSNELEF